MKRWHTLTPVHGPTFNVVGWRCKRCPGRWPDLPPIDERTGCPTVASNTSPRLSGAAGVFDGAIEPNVTPPDVAPLRLIRHSASVAPLRQT